MSDGRTELTASPGCSSPQAVSTEELVRLVEAGADWIWETNHELRFSWLSDTYQSVTGIAPQEVLGRSSLDLANQISKHGSGTESHLANIEARAPFRDCVCELRGGKPECRWVSLTGYPRFDSDRNFVGYRGIGRNVTSVKLGPGWILGTEQELGLFWLSSDFPEYRQLSHVQERKRPTANVLDDSHTEMPFQDSGTIVISAEITDLQDQQNEATGSLILASAGKPERQYAAPVHVTGARVLVVDDNAVNGMILSEQIVSWGFESCAAENGPEGISVLLAAADAGIAVDCVVLEYGMADMTGADVARIIRSTPSIADTPIVMLTSVDQSLSNSTYRDLPIEAQLIKPARSSALLETLVDTIQMHRQAPPVIAAPQAEAETSAPPARPAQPNAAQPIPADSHRLDILVAEDNVVDRLVFTQILTGTPYSFDIVGSGHRAVESFKEMAPRMILMDVFLSDMNGFDATVTIRALESGTLSHVPIVGLTAQALKGDREHCVDAGMDDYLPKPISPDALLDKVEEWIGVGAGQQRSAG